MAVPQRSPGGIPAHPAALSPSARTRRRPASAAGAAPSIPVSQRRGTQDAVRTAVAVGDRTQQSAAGHPDRAAPSTPKQMDDSPEAAAVQWGRAQAARAPRWSADKRRRIAVLLGLVLPAKSGPDREPGAGRRSA